MTPDARSDVKWDEIADVVIIGTGAAGCTAAVVATDAGAKVLMLEKMPATGGTTIKSAGGVWIPNNYVLKSQGVIDDRHECLKYMARYAYPQSYNPEDPNLGLFELDYKLLCAYYDNAAKAIDKIRGVKAGSFRQLLQVDGLPASDYADHLPENKLPTGRCMIPDDSARLSSGMATGQWIFAGYGGAQLISRMEEWLQSRNVPIFLETEVTSVIMSDGVVIGVEAQRNGKPIKVRARRGVIFATGGYAHNTQLVDRHQVALYGACAGPGSTGDFIPIASRIGAQLGSLQTAWRAEVVFDEVIENRMVARCATLLPGDSMLVLNKYGVRAVNEKRNYNDRTRAHFDYDSTAEDYPNQLLFMLFDDRTLKNAGGIYPVPKDPREAAYVVTGKNIEELTDNLAKRLDVLRGKTGGVRLAPDFAVKARATISRFNGYAKIGTDAEYHRGAQVFDRKWSREMTPKVENPLPNSTMYPLTGGPYYAIILAAGALDTNGGPLIDENAQVLHVDGKPIPGLYGAGNCIASPTRGAYLGGGATIGLCLTFGYIAGRNAAARSAI
jgi:3-oxosteroid 1-dehydrogenase